MVLQPTPATIYVTPPTDTTATSTNDKVNTPPPLTEDQRTLLGSCKELILS